MNEIEVDFNNRGAHGTVRGSLRRAGRVKVGDSVILIDSEEGLRFDALVSSIDADSGRVLYSVSWERPGLLDLLADSTANAFHSPTLVSTAGAPPTVQIDPNSVPRSFGPFAMPIAV